MNCAVTVTVRTKLLFFQGRNQTCSQVRSLYIMVYT